MYILNIVSNIKKISVSEPRDFIIENYYKRIGFVKERSYDLLLLSNKLTKKYLILVMLNNTTNHS